jgi:hypothetical protein
MANYKSLKASVDKNGEVMIRLDTGESIELHKHNVSFNDNTQEIVVDSGTAMLSHIPNSITASIIWIEIQSSESRTLVQPIQNKST